MKNWGSVLFSLVAFSYNLIAADGKKLQGKLNKFKWTPKLLEPIKVGHMHQMTLFPFHKRRVKTLSVHPPIFEIKNFLSEVECDHLISYAKRLGLEKSPLIKPKDTMDEETSERTFKIWDNNDDGFIEPVEIMHVRGKEDLFFTEKDLLEMFEELHMDGDGNGKIDFDEFSAVTVPVMIKYFDKLRTTRPRLRSRNSKQAWMFHNDPKYPILSDFHGRLARLTLLPEELIRNSEPLQVVKYDVHGHYHCHMDSDEIDFSLPCCTFTDEENCRLCRFVTVMFYLNEPEKGGQTAFPLANNETYSEEAWTRDEGWKCNLAENCHESNLIVKPEKGKAVMWYNHFLDKKTGWLGDLDPMTHHGGCDVIKGTKWIANAWLALVGDLGTGDAFKGWIDLGKDESVFEPGTNWKGEAIKKGERENNEEACTSDEKGKEEAMKDQARETDDKEKEVKQEHWKKEEKYSKEDEKDNLIREAKKQKGGSYDVKLEL